MSSRDARSVAAQYVGAAGRDVDGRYQLPLDELVWLVEHSTRLGELRLELLRALQTALPKSDEPGSVAELKDLLTNLIIMQTRVAGQGERLPELLALLHESGELDYVAIDEDAVRGAIEGIVGACARVEAAGGSGS